MFSKSLYFSTFLILIIIATWIRADDEEVQVYDGVDDDNWNKTVSGEVEASDPDDRSEKLSKKRAVHEETNEVQEQVKAELDKAVESLKEAAKEREEEENGLLGPVNLESCGTVDCNHRGTCLGTKKTYICACQLGYSGKNCEDTVCDSARDCNGRGLCLGTTSTLTCLCNLGFSGKHCQTAI